MRIIAGELRGRQFQAPHGHRTHPMSDKVRGALFNVLGDIEGLSFLDAFAGSGALAFEAASRGASSVVAVDSDSAAHKVIDQNLKDLRLQKIVRVTRANIGGWSLHNMEKRFDIILLDPPFDEPQLNLINKLIKRHIKKGGLAVLNLPGKTEIPVIDNTEVAASRHYGDAQLVFYRKLK